MIKEVMENEVFGLFNRKEVSKAEQRLKSLAMQINENTCTEDKRLVFYNLSVAYRMLGREKMSKFYIKLARSHIMNDDEYLYDENNIGKITDVELSYIDYFPDEFTKEEIMDINYKNCLFYSMNENTLERAMMSRFNMAMLDNDIDKIFDTVRVVLNYIITYRDNEEMYEKLNFVKNEIFNDIKKYDEQLYEEIINSFT